MVQTAPPVPRLAWDGAAGKRAAANRKCRHIDGSAWLASFPGFWNRYRRAQGPGPQDSRPLRGAAWRLRRLGGLRPPPCGPGPTPSAQIPILHKKSSSQSIQAVLPARVLFYIQWPVQSSPGKISPLRIHLAPSRKEPSFRVFPPTVTLVQAHTLHKNRCHILYKLY